MRQHDFVIDILTNPEYQIKTVLNIGYRHDSNRSIQNSLESRGIKFSVLEAYTPNCETLRSTNVCEEIINLDCKNIDQLEKKYDAIIWLHGPEHITWSEFKSIRQKIEEKANKVVIYQGPDRPHPQGELYGNPYEKHLQDLDWVKFKELGYNISFQNILPENTFSAYTIKDIKHSNETKLFTNKPKYYAVTGLPRSGTTIVSNLLNSFDNSFCFSEPIWIYIENKDSLRYGKLKDEIKFDNIENIIPDLHKVISDKKYLIGGIKETFRDFQPAPNPVRMINDYSEFDFKVVVLRDPVSNFSGWKLRSFGPEYTDPVIFERNYNHLIDYIESEKKKTPVYVIKYDSFCNQNNLREYINNIFASEFQIIGNNITLKPTGYTNGDPRGNNSNTIVSARKEVENLTDREIDICSSLQERYNNIIEGSQQC